MNKLKPIDFNLKNLSFKQFRQHQIDLLIVVGLGFAIAISTFLGTHQIPDPIFTDFYAQDVWFGSDIPTVFGNITSVNSDFGRNNKHPLFPLIVFPCVFILSKLLSLDPLSAVRILVTVVSVLWVSSLYALFRLMGCYRLDATLLSILGGVSAASMFWLVTPESFSFGSVTIVLGLLFVVLTQYHQLPMLWYVAVNVLTVSITITNSMVGIFATLINQRWKRIIQIGVLSLAISTSLWVLQRIVFTNTGFPFQPGTFIGERKFMSAPANNEFFGVLGSFFFQTMIMPAIEFLNSPIRPNWIKIETNPFNPASGGWLAGIAILAWTGLLLLGIGAFFSIKQHYKLRIVLGLTLIAQLLIHSVYGVQETVIYILHFAPLLLTLVAFSFFTRFRPLSLALALILIVSAGVTNRSQFNRVTAELWNYGTPHQQIEAQMKRRPSDPWMRNEGHVILAAGSTLESKAFHEPGGSFSPKPGSFGVSIWMVDAQGRIQATSDSIPLKDIRQQFTTLSNSTTPRISTQTPYYQSSWSVVQPDRWQLTFNRVASTDLQPVLVIRSVGPAGGEIHSLNWNGQRLLINDRWIVKNFPSSVTVHLGSERSPDWTRQKPTVTQWQDEHGWGYARLDLSHADRWNIEVEDLKPEPASTLITADSTATYLGVKPTLNIPDARFRDSLNAQVSHLLMGIVSNQTRPGDPIAYPLPRFRDGAYELVALARTGNLEVAKQLVPYFAATDFVNGTQPEADIPALGIWALTTVAEQVNQPEYDRLVWEDVRRKANLITDLIATNRPGYPIASASEVPFLERQDLIRLELVAGRMDALPGLITLDPAANYMSYRALLDAATLADRLQQTALATRWRSSAVQLHAAWQAMFDLRFTEMDATYTNGIYPSGIATPNQESFVKALEARWQKNYDNAGNLRQLPDNTNSSVAEVHQWLYLNRGDRVWSTLQWFWNHQSSPGLYTWWGKVAGVSPASLSQWQRFRGWVTPSPITPYYSTAAEMVLLQLDMLAYLNPTTDTPTVVIGAGIPQEWLKQPLSARGLWVGGTLLDWEWDGKQINVQMQGKLLNVQLGDAFSATTPINVVNPQLGTTTAS